MEIRIWDEADITLASQTSKKLAITLGFSDAEQAAIITSIMEIARNIFKYAGSGTIKLETINENKRIGIHVLAKDNGPGIENLELAMQDGYSKGNSLGLGLPGANRLMDTFTLQSEVNKGTTISMIKWKACQEQNSQ